MRIKGTAARGRRADLRRTAGAALFGMAAASAALGQPLPPNPYADLSLEELANVVITSVARRPQALAGAAASVFLITGEDLRRSGVVTVPEALRLAPNLQVAALNAHEYAITTRGFTSSIANKLLVMIDGRTVYSPLFSGVFWDAQDLVIDDIDRIEVISGPGGATWGTNAVNGVINIVTRDAAETQGVLAKATAGTEERSVAARHGFALGAQTHARIYAKHYAHDATALVAGGTAADGWKRAQAGFRIDGGTAAGRYTLQGDLYRGRSDDRPTFGALKSSGANLLGRWSQRLSENADFDIQGYYDRADRTDNFLLQERVRLFDLEAKGRFLSGAHRWLVGAGHRRATDHSDPGVYFAFVPPRRADSWTSVFVQDEVAIGSDLQLTVGTRLERNPYTGWEVLPSARLGWTVTPQHFIWTGLSRTVRSPARLDREIVFPTQPPYQIAGGPDFESEIARTAEIGYRGRPTGRFSWSATAFATDYRKLRSAQIDALGVITIANGIEGQVRGVEAAVQWQVLRPWRLRAGLVLLDKDLRLVPGSNDPVGPSNLGNDPKHQWSLRSNHNLGERVELEAALRRVGALPQPVVPAYTAVDLRLLWRVRDGVEVAFFARNAFDPGHVEFRNDPSTSEIARSVGLTVRWVLP